VPTGRLYNAVNDEFIANVNYQFQHEDDNRWWGELTLIEYRQIKDGAGYLIEIEDGRRSRCALKKRVNRAVSALPPRYVFHFSGTGQFEY
jgi:hypothetical protein